MDTSCAVCDKPSETCAEYAGERVALCSRKCQTEYHAAYEAYRQEQHVGEPLKIGARLNVEELRDDVQKLDDHAFYTGWALFTAAVALMGIEGKIPRSDASLARIRSDVVFTGSSLTMIQSGFVGFRDLVKKLRDVVRPRFVFNRRRKLEKIWNDFQASVRIAHNVKVVAQSLLKKPVVTPSAFAENSELANLALTYMLEIEKLAKQSSGLEATLLDIGSKITAKDF
jgi:hypothetical protein